jgi:imidazolonepropionase-like amidohydrolase
MQKMSRSILPASLALAVGSPAQKQENRPITALVGATLIYGTGAAPQPDTVVIVEGEKIREVGRRSLVAIPPGARIIDVSKKWILPGFRDLHMHLTDGRY